MMGRVYGGKCMCNGEVLIRVYKFLDFIKYNIIEKEKGAFRICEVVIVYSILRGMK